MDDSGPLAVVASAVATDLGDGGSEVLLAGRSAPWRAEGAVLDTHIYQYFMPALRKFSPKGHISEVCRGDHKWIERCCEGKNETGSDLSRMVGEFTLAYDQTPGVLLEGFPVRPLTPARRTFLKQYAKAQMVMYEREAGGEDDFVGWFFWNFKMEAEVYREWDYLRGVREGWIPKLEAGKSAEKAFGTCLEIETQTEDAQVRSVP